MSSWSRLPRTARRTLAFDVGRAFSFGILDSGPRTFFLLVAIDHFDATDFLRTAVASGVGIGLLATLFVTAALGRLRVAPNRVAAAMLGGSAICTAAAALAASSAGFAGWLMAGTALWIATAPLFTTIFGENYPTAVRGRLFALGGMSMFAASAAFHAVGGALLEASSDNYRAVLLVMAGAAALAASMVASMPSTPRAAAIPNARKASRVLGALALLWRDRTFGRVVLGWALFGLGFATTIPLRVLFLTEAEHGLNLPAGQVALLIGTVPDITRMVMTPLWAYLFDRFNFIAVRIALNTSALISVALFFLFPTPALLFAAAIFNGNTLAGGNIAWNLWVTRVAPPGRTTEYMSVHTSITGVRMLLGAVLSVNLVGVVGARAIAIAAMVSILAGSAILAGLVNDAARFRAKPDAAQ
jgi:MFS family permease